MNVPADPVSPTGSNTDDAIRTAFELGWNLAELNARIRASLGRQPTSSRRVLALWRVILFKIGGLHARAFPSSTTGGTLYELPAKTPPYLFPAVPPDYVTINTAACPVGLDPQLQGFALYDTARRAINCLCLLYLNAAEWLAEEDIEARQKSIREQIEVPGENTDSKGVLGTFACRVLDAWNDYVREHYFAGGAIPNSDIESIAFEAGRTMASISWEITAASVGIESIVDAHATEVATKPDVAPVDSEQSAAEVATEAVTKSTAAESTEAVAMSAAVDPTEAVRKLEEAWTSAFRPEVIIRLQHYISELSSALGSAEQITPRLEALESVKKSIDYWQRTVTLQATLFASGTLSTQGKEGAQSDSQTAEAASAQARDRIKTWKKMRLALTRQANIWESLMIGQQDLTAFDVESVATRLVQSVWSSIQTDLRGQFSQAVSEMTTSADAELKLFYRKSRVYLIPLFIFVVLVAGATALLVIFSQPDPNSKLSGLASVLSATGVGSAVVGAIGWIKSFYAEKQAVAPSGTRSQNSPSSIVGHPAFFSRVQGAADDVLDEIQDALKRGMQQLETQMKNLSHGVAVTYPLIECLVTIQSLKSDVEFLEKVVWTGTDRVADMKTVIAAALGPMWIFLGTSQSKVQQPGH
ncbi:hypothetical protein [Caballeronia sp. GaOx3]|uniref:hypothetical protein n=1 Tax=Caballeronia sp. GaOx3 TaxID=2921740 RepID=UPI002028DED2|nr:hypothetical protein [Caballeronia sp. GaOx3]